MIFKSIRWRLQIWYGVILIAVLVGFGLTAYEFERARQFRAIDAELQRRNSVLLAGLALRDGPRQGGPRGERPPPEDELDGFPPFGGPPEDRQPRGGFRLPAKDAGLFGGMEKNSFYYAIWRRGGQEIQHSTNAPEAISVPAQPNPNSGDIPRQRDMYRESYHFTPMGECVLTGRSIAIDLAELRKFALLLTGVGSAVLLCGLAGGWFLASRAIRPINDISNTAVKIAQGDLSQRIDVADTENELGRLASVLNSTFARLDASFAQQAQFTADAAHELRTPVSVILAQTQTSLKRERNSTEYRDTVEACQRAAQRMRGLLESLLELARLDAGQEAMKKMRFDLSATVQECVELIRPLTQQRNIQVHGEFSPLEWSGDRERLSQVITNLLSNAIHYNKDGGEVRVAVQQRNGEATVTVADTGVGIAAEDLPRIFERFYRADKSRSNAAGRTGLGLAISKAIVEAHGGRLEVSSEPGKGTVFTLHLPGER